MNAIEEELNTIDLGDQRLNRRARRVLEQLGSNPSGSIPAACGGWSESKAAYRLFDHKEVTAQQILEPHYQASEQRMKQHPLVLCIQDTSELDYSGQEIEGLGPLNYESRQGLYLHPTLAVTPERLCLGVIDAWCWSREPGSLGKRSAAHRPIEEKESVRWLEGYQRVNELATQLPETRLVYVADREADIYEVYEQGERASEQAHQADWLIRGEYDRCLAQSGKLKEAVEKAPEVARIEFDLPNRKNGKARRVEQVLRQARVTLKPPYRAGRKLAPVSITVLLAEEISPPPGETAVKWMLLSNREVGTPEQAVEMLQWYLCRWQIELFFKILKSGCRIEKLQLETLQRLEPALAFYLIIAWRVLYLTVLGRVCPDLPCDVVFATEEWQAVYVLSRRQPPPSQPPPLNEMIRMVAVLGGFLNRKGDGFPGSQTLWIGLQRSRDFVIAMEAQRATFGQTYG